MVDTSANSQRGFTGVPIMCNILSRTQGLSIITIKEILLFEWLISNKVSDQAITFLLNSKEEEIEESTTQEVNLKRVV